MITKFSCLLFAALCGMNAQAPTYQWESTTAAGFPSVVMVPSTATAVVTVTLPKAVKVDQINLHNITGSAVTVTITDNSANCNGAQCAVVSPPLSIAANTTYTIYLGGQPAAGGVSWSATTANAVEGWIGGRF